MNTEKFTAAYGESRNGANHFVRHWAARSLQYSDGVESCAEAGCFWLLDIIATEALKPLRASGDGLGIIAVKVADGKADIGMTIEDDAPPVWSRHVDYTDMPPGEWKFFLADEGERFALILPTEY
jgi:hypothetical protein